MGAWCPSTTPGYGDVTQELRLDNQHQSPCQSLGWTAQGVNPAVDRWFDIN